MEDLSPQTEQSLHSYELVDGFRNAGWAGFQVPHSGLWSAVSDLSSSSSILPLQHLCIWLRTSNFQYL